VGKVHQNLRKGRGVWISGSIGYSHGLKPASTRLVAVIGYERSDRFHRASDFLQSFLGLAGCVSQACGSRFADLWVLLLGLAVSLITWFIEWDLFLDDVLTDTYCSFSIC
jgi:hypothetical protein